MRISFSTLLGVFFGVGLVAWGIVSVTDQWTIFLSFPSLFIVLGGTITAAFIGYKWTYIFKAFTNIFEIFIEPGINSKSLKKDVTRMISWAEQVQKEGIEGYGKIAAQLPKKEKFIHYVLSLMETGYTTREVYEFGENSIEETYFRNLTGTSILNTMAASAPAFGMVGTLIGLIVMLSEMEDPSEMGPGLGLALVTTLYGVLFARYLFDPTSTKVKQLYSIQRFREFLLLEGLIMIMENRSTFYIRDRLNSFLDRNVQVSAAEGNK
ncbi:MAG: motility protein A [Fibrobacterota bacterium]